MKKMLSCLVILAAAVTGVFFFHPGHSGASFVANDLMSDGIFDNTNYSAAQIDAFLNTFPNSCISTNHGFTAAEPIGYSASTGHFSYGNYVSAGTVPINIGEARASFPLATHFTIDAAVRYASDQPRPAHGSEGAGEVRLKYSF